MAPVSALSPIHTATAGQGGFFDRAAKRFERRCEALSAACEHLSEISCGKTWPFCCPSSGMCAHLQACGRINDHAAACPCFHRINEAYPVVLLKSDQEAAQQRTGGGKSERLKRDHGLQCHDNFPDRMQATAENLHFSWR